MSNDTREAPYGYCPECGAAGVTRERRPDGNDRCANGHTYPSRNAHKAIAAKTDTREALAALPPLPESGVYHENSGEPLGYTAEQMHAYARAALATQPAQPDEGQMKAPQDGMQFWLWKNGDHFLAFTHPYPCFTPGGDPMVLGEPAGRAVFRRSHHRSERGNATQPAQPSAQGEAVAHPSHLTVREWMPVNEALRLADVWSAGDLDNCGQWRAAIKVLADEVRALASAPAAPAQAVPLTQRDVDEEDASWVLPNDLEDQ